MIRIFLLFLLMFSSNIFSAEKQVVISVYEEWSHELGIIKELLTESYNEIGYKVIFKDLPPARALSELSHGKIDGDIARTERVAQEHNAIIVRPPYFTLKAYAYYQKDRFKKAPSIKDVKNGLVGFMNGSFAVEKFLTNPNSSIKANNQLQLLNLLKLKRVDYIVPSASLSTKDGSLGKILLFELSIYHILSNKNKELVKKLEPILKKNMSKKKYSDMENQIKKLLLENPK